MSMTPENMDDIDMSMTPENIDNVMLYRKLFGLDQGETETADSTSSSESAEEDNDKIDSLDD